MWWGGGGMTAFCPGWVRSRCTSTRSKPATTAGFSGWGVGWGEGRTAFCPGWIRSTHTSTRTEGGAEAIQQIRLGRVGLLSAQDGLNRDTQEVKRWALFVWTRWENSVQCTVLSYRVVYSVQHTVLSYSCVLYSPTHCFVWSHCVLYSVQHTVLSSPTVLYSVQHTVSSCPDKKRSFFFKPCVFWFVFSTLAVIFALDFKESSETMSDESRGQLRVL